MDEARPTISVLMPAYNAERYVVEAIESILAQTFRDFEFIVIDDGSTDGSKAILEAYAAHDPRIRLISRPNTGLVGALNEGLEIARGNLIARMDADDIAIPDRFALQVAFLDENPDVVCVGGAVLLIDERGRRLAQLSSPLDDPAIQETSLSGRSAISHPAAMMRRGVLAAVGGYRQDLYPAEDVDLWLRLGERGRLANLPQVVLKYREHGASVSHRNQAIQLERCRLAVAQACDRRGIPQRDFAAEPHRPGTDRDSRHRFALRNGWWAFGSGDRLMAMRFACRSILLSPLQIGGWKLLACASLKPIRVGP